MRALLLAAAALAASPIAAQDHSGHADHGAMPQHGTAEEPESDAGETADHAHMNHGQMDHGHTDRGAADHAEMDHSQMGHAAPDADRAESASHAGHAEHAQGAAAPAASGHGSHPVPSASSQPPPRALEGPEHAADAIFGAAAMARSRAENEAMDRMTYGAFILERLEARLGKGEDVYLWDAQGWYGGDIDKLWLKSEGEGAFGGELESAEVQALWSHAIDPWFDVQAGIRYDFEPEGRAHAVLGVQGLAPYMFEVDAAAFLSDRGDLTANLEAEYDQRITQRLILQPRAEISLSAQDIPRLGIGAGVSSVETGLRLRYEFLREFAPYIGVDYEAKVGKTADLARAAGEASGRLAFLIGLRAWF